LLELAYLPTIKNTFFSPIPLCPVHMLMIEYCDFFKCWWWN